MKYASSFNILLAFNYINYLICLGIEFLTAKAAS